MGATLERAIGILNGTIGDHLARTGNGLATQMRCVLGGEALPLVRAALARAYPAATGRVALLVHGVMGTERDFVMPDGSDYGSRLARDLGFTPVYVRYNSGRTIEESGADLSALLARLVEAYPAPVEEIMPVGYSMGGLVARSALHAATRAGLAWPSRVRRAVYIGSPHRGAPMERWGRVVARFLHAVPDPVTRMVADVADLRSAGVKVLGDPHEAPLAPAVRHLLVAGSVSGVPLLAALLGDAVVPLSSALDGRHGEGAALDAPTVRVRLVHGVSHVALAHDPRVYEEIRAWCREGEAA